MNRIDVLPDDVLLEIIEFYVNTRLRYEGKWETDSWQTLVHVCRRWRHLIFGSPRHLNLQLHCTHETPTRDKLDVWPALPLIIEGGMISSGMDNIIAALGRSNRVRSVFLFSIEDRQLEQVLAAMEVPFPELTELQLISDYGTLPIIPNSFLDGSAPRLRILRLDNSPFPGLPKLLLSATHLVDLHLYDIPHSGYISPEAMVALLSALSSLKNLTLEFQSPHSRPDWESRRPLPPKRSVVPALASFRFGGVIEYLEDLVTFIDAPQLDYFGVTFLNQIDFDTPRLAQFIDRAPKLRKRDALVQFYEYSASVGLPALSRETRILDIEISSRDRNRQLSFIAQVCNSSLSPLTTVEDLFIKDESRPGWDYYAIENTLWLKLFLPFTVVKNLYLSKKIAPRIAAALQELIGGGTAEVLPSLENIFVEELESSGPFRENIGQFVAARQLSNHPIAIFDWYECFAM